MGSSAGQASVTPRERAIRARLEAEATHGRDPLDTAARVIAALEGGVSFGLIRADPPDNPRPLVGLLGE